MFKRDSLDRFPPNFVQVSFKSCSFVKMDKIRRFPISVFQNGGACKPLLGVEKAD